MIARTERILPILTYANWCQLPFVGKNSMQPANCLFVKLFHAFSLKGIKSEFGDQKVFSSLDEFQILLSQLVILSSSWIWVLSIETNWIQSKFSFIETVLVHHHQTIDSSSEETWIFEEYSCEKTIWKWFQYL